MGALSQFAHETIDWNLTPEHAVTMYLEWGNNDWHAEYPPVLSKSDQSTYFVVDTWDADGPKIRLVRRNSEQAVDLACLPFPQALRAHFDKEYGSLKGIFAPSEEIKNWLKKELEVSPAKGP